MSTSVAGLHTSMKGGCATSVVRMVLTAISELGQTMGSPSRPEAKGETLEGEPSVE